jgi:transposase
VKLVLGQGTPEPPPFERESKLLPHLERIRDLHVRCGGNLVRVGEELRLRGVSVGYSTLTQFCRAHDIGTKPRKRSGRYHFAPGEEMQHDTSPHSVEIAGRTRLMQCASLVLCYSRMQYAQLFPSFDRFACRVFLSEAIAFFGASAGRCVVDGTSVVRVRGWGDDAVVADELAALADRFGFRFWVHAPGHANRSARVERPFHYIENNFYKGRAFSSLDDANAQLRDWCDRKNRRFQKHIRAVPIELFAAERPAMKPLPAYVPEVYALHVRRIDSDGFVNLHTNRYSIPDAILGRAMTLHETRSTVRVFDRRRLVFEHVKAESGAGLRITIPGHHPRGSVSAQKGAPTAEEAALRAADPMLGQFVDELRRRHGGRAVRSIRQLHRLWIDYPTDAVVRAVTAALPHDLLDLGRIERMVLRSLAGTYFRLTADPLEDDVDER